MTINRVSYFYIFFILLFYSCIEKEIPVNPYEIGDIDLHTVGIGSDYSQQVYYSLSSSEVIASNQSLQRNLVPEDLVGTILYLASDDSKFVTGQTIMVDGGTVFL